MVDATQFEDLELYRDPNNSDRFIARDPSDGSLYAIPFEEVEATDATVTNNLTVNNKTTTGTLEATKVFSNSQQIDKNGNYQITTAINLTVSADSRETLFNSSTETYCLGGVLNSTQCTIEITIDGNSYEGSKSTAQVPRAENFAGDTFAVTNIPSVYAESSLKIEAVNTASNDDVVVGAKIRTHQP